MILWSACSLLGAWFYFRANGYLEAWNFQKQENPQFYPSIQDYTNAISNSERAIRLVPYNSDYRLKMAHLLSWQLFYDPSIASNQRIELIKRIKEHYRVALTQRPNWAYHYHDYAQFKALIGEVDKELEHLLAKSQALGPYEIDILHSIIKMGVFLWPELSLDGQKQVIKAVNSSLSWRGENTRAKEKVYVFSLIGLKNRMSNFCPLIDLSDDSIRALCAPYLVKAEPSSTKANK
ncbi:hypothetical protein [Agitococcus lubricus]|nr:hypothetical protein [Agitococcus lubricus]